MEFSFSAASTCQSNHSLDRLEQNIFLQEKKQFQNLTISDEIEISLCQKYHSLLIPNLFLTAGITFPLQIFIGIYTYIFYQMKKFTHNQKDFQDYLSQNYPPLTPKINFGSQYQIPVGPDGIQYLVQYLTWNIENLNISMHAVKDEGFQILINQQLKRGAWTNLREVATIKNQLTSEGLKGIERVNWPNLQNLIFNENKIDHLGVELLIKAQFSKSIKKLFLGNNNIGIEGCQKLSRSQWPCFERIGLNYNLITNQGLAFLQLAHWPKLTEINLSNNKLDAKGMVFLEKANWPQLQILNLSRNKIGMINETQLTDIGCLHLSKMKTKSIKNFGVFGNDISLNGIRTIFRSTIFLENCFLQLVKNKFTFDEVKPYIQEFKLFCNEFDD